VLKSEAVHLIIYFNNKEADYTVYKIIVYEPCYVFTTLGEMTSCFFILDIGVLKNGFQSCQNLAALLSLYIVFKIQNCEEN